MTVKPIETTKAFQGMPTQEESNYVPLSTSAGKACANCRWFIADFQQCFIIDNHPEPILATGYCDRHELTPAPKSDPAEVLAEAITEALEENAETIVSAMPMYADLGKALEEPSILNKIWHGLRSIVIPTKQQSDIMVFKGKDGKNYWLAAFTNNFKDRDDEILSEHAHKEFEQRLDMKLVPMPELWAWHTEGTRHGKALTVWYQDHDMFAIGLFDDTPAAQKAMTYYSKYPVKLSHGFVAPTWAFKNGVYDAYNTFEISTLPPQVAANPYTSFEEIKAMPVPETREAFIKELFGASAPDVLAKVNAKTEASKELGELVEYKDFSNTLEKKPDTEDTEVTKSLGLLYTEVVEGQTELINFVKSLVKASNAKDEMIAALKTEKDTQVSDLQKSIEELRTILNAPPSRSSQVTRTLVTDKDGLKDQLPKEPDTFFGDLYAPSPTANGAKR